MATAAFADSPHFLFADASVSTSTGALDVNFEEAGLGTTVTTEQVTLTGGQRHHRLPVLQQRRQPPQGRQQGDRDRAGDRHRVVPGAQRPDHGHHLGRPTQPGGLHLPVGQSLFLQSVTYSGITVTGAAGDSLGATPDPAASGPIHILIS